MFSNLVLFFLSSSCHCRAGHYSGHDFGEFSETKSVKSAGLSGLARPWLTDRFLPINHRNSYQNVLGYEYV